VSLASTSRLPFAISRIHFVLSIRCPRTMLTMCTYYRDVSTATLTAAGNQELLDRQRALRPNSPWHIYQPQLTSLSSIANRVTGTGLSVGECHPLL
jgi:hypothetical protein